jgi:hypothetical protein
MYASVRDYEGNSELVDALLDNEGEVRRIISEIDGFEAYYLIRTAEGTAVSVSVYDGESSASQSNEVAANWIRENLSDMPISAPRVFAGEVALNF